MFRAIGIILSWLPTIISVVTALEQLAAAKTGPEKKELALEALYRVLGQSGVTLNSTLKTLISSVIDAIVAVLNLIGVAGFADGPEQETVDLIPSSHAAEVEALDRKLELKRSSAPSEEASAKAVPSESEERLNELEEILVSRQKATDE